MKKKDLTVASFKNLLDAVRTPVYPDRLMTPNASAYRYFYGYYS